MLRGTATAIHNHTQNRHDIPKSLLRCSYHCLIVGKSHSFHGITYGFSNQLLNVKCYRGEGRAETLFEFLCQVTPSLRTRHQFAQLQFVASVDYVRFVHWKRNV